MKRYFYFIAIVLVNYFGYCQAEEIVEETVIESFPPDQGVYKNGLKEDFWVNYSKDYTEKGKYVGDKKDGEWIIYDKNNNIKSVENYKSGSKHGKWTQYSKNGKIQRIKNFKSNKKHGDFISYYDNDIIYVKVEYSKGIKSGKRVSYYQSGKIKQSGEYIKGKQTGNWVTYFENGLVEKSENYLQDEKNGEWQSFTESGNIQVSGKYLNNKKKGEWKSYYSKIKGLLHRNSTFDNGRLVNYSEYRKDKSLQRKVKVINTADDKKYYIEEYDLHGNIEYTGNKNSLMKKIGVWKEYNSNGDLIQIKEYKNGTLKE